MIYIQHGLNTNQMQATGQGFTAFLYNYHPRRITITANNRDAVKRGLDYAISGTMDGNTRSNASIKARDVLAVDLDYISPELTDVTIYHELEKALSHSNWYLYPTATNELGRNRYRLIVMLEAPITSPEDYSALVSLITHGLGRAGIITAKDGSNATWGQLFGTPVINQFYPPNLPLIRKHDGLAYPTDKKTMQIVRNILKQEYNENPTPGIVAPVLPKTRGAYKNPRPKSAGLTYTGRLLSEFANGITEGARNNKLFELVVYSLSQGMDVAAIWKLVQGFNSCFVYPSIDGRELTALFRSAMNTRRKDLNND